MATAHGNEPLVGVNLYDLAGAMVAQKRHHFICEADRDDAVQDLILVGLECLQKDKDSETLRSYQVASMRGALMNFIRDRFSSAKREKAILDVQVEDGERLGNILAIAPEHGCEIDRNFVALQVRSALAGLPDKKLVHIVEAHVLEGRTLTDIGAELRISAERVRQLKVQAFEMLRLRLADYAEHVA